MYLGVDYYPEHWAPELMDEDLKRIKEMGANIIRIGEFAWHLMESTEGCYDFSFFDKVIEKAKEHDLKIIFGTPTATFPAWLAKKHPSILSKDEYGHTRAFGGRRQYCFNSGVYRKYAEKIVKELVSHYKNEKSVIVWQIDNEFGHEGSDLCYCEECHRGFQQYLQKKYTTIEKLNEVYGTVFWGQTYNSFDEIPLPQPTITTHNPSLRLDWARFRSYSINSFAAFQIDLVNKLKGSHQLVTHNLPGGFFEKAYDQNELADRLDFVSYDNYPVWGGLREPIKPEHIAMAHDYIRGLKGSNYWIVEEIMGAQGHDIIGWLPRPGQAKMWAYHAVAHGCENMLFFRWRGMTKGAEQFCTGIIDQDNQNGRKYREVRSFISDIKKYESLIKSDIKSDIAVLYDYDNIWSWRFQRQSSEFDFTKELLRLYTPFYRLNTNIDVISSRKDFKEYKVLLVPVMQIIDEDLGKRFSSFVEKGGTIVFSFRAGIKDRDNNLHFAEKLPYNIHKIAGILVKEGESLQAGQEVPAAGKGKYEGRRGFCSVWRDIIEADTAEVLYCYNDGSFKGKPFITVNRYEKGKVYYIGGGADAGILADIAEGIVEDNNIRYEKSPEGLEVYVRNSGSEEWRFINNHTEKIILYGEVKIMPYESRIIKT